MGAVEQFSQLTPVSAPAWLNDVHKRGGAIWRNCIWPGRKTESWKYTNLRCIEQGEYLHNVAEAQESDQVKTLLDASGIKIEGLAGDKLVFVNGVFSKALSMLGNIQLDDSLYSLVPFSQANDAQAEIIQQHLNSTVSCEEHMFASLNNQLMSDGVLLHVSKNKQVSEPITVVHITTAQTKNFNVQQRLLVVLEESSAATVVEHFVSAEDPQNVFVNGVTEFCVGENANLKHYRLNQEQEDTIHIGAVHTSLARNANLNSFYLARGSELKRLDVVVAFNGEGAHSEINGVYIPHRNQHVDFHTCIEHQVPHCTSQEVFRGIIGDTAKAVFNGRIHIHKDAQKTLAQLSNKNLLTSTKAEINTKPELEIYADDVQCAHGATVAQLDETSMHYLRTRGVSEKEAEVMLSFGFINELINKIELEPVREYLRPILAGHFARDPSLIRHLV